MFREKQRSIFIGLSFGIAGLLPYVATIVLTSSLVVLAELLKNAALVVAVLMSWLALRRAARGKDPYFNYGYGKVESLQSLAVAGVLAIAFGIVLYEVIRRFQNPEEVGGVGLVIGIASAGMLIVGNALLWRHDHHLAKHEASPVMESLWRLYRVKTIASVCVFLALLLSLAFREFSWAEYIDPAGSIVILGFLAYTAYGVITMSVYDLLDGTLDESLQLAILRELAGHFDKYDNVHGIRSRRSGSSVYIELFLEFDGDRRMGDVQKSIDELKEALEANLPGSQVSIMPTTSPIAPSDP